jgi:Cytochrome P460
MKTRSRLLAVAGAITIAGLIAASQVRAAGDRVAFPEDYAKGVRYLTLDKPDSRDVRDYYASPAAAEAAKKGVPLPDSTVITVVQYAAQLDAEGKPTRDANGRLTRTDKILGYVVMEKQAGWGAAYPEQVRNGDWEYQVFRPDKTVNRNANLTSCFTCHRPQASQDFIFTGDSLKTAAP